MSDLETRLRAWAERDALARFSHDWAHGVDHNKGARAGFEIGALAMLELLLPVVDAALLANGHGGASESAKSLGDALAALEKTVGGDGK